MSNRLALLTVQGVGLRGMVEAPGLDLPITRRVAEDTIAIRGSG